ncbi:hypothetical protein ACETRX_27750 [Labrys portucalensis]|uniref:Uncharacterized protein n=1 Tax=Labrys neptuniae TaxID=376174 RepID=A0ABV6ZMQ6_9HYPH
MTAIDAGVDADAAVHEHACSLLEPDARSQGQTLDAWTTGIAKRGRALRQDEYVIVRDFGRNIDRRELEGFEGATITRGCLLPEERADNGPVEHGCLKLILPPLPRVEQVGADPSCFRQQLAADLDEAWIDLDADGNGGGLILDPSTSLPFASCAITLTRRSQTPGLSSSSRVCRPKLMEARRRSGYPQPRSQLHFGETPHGYNRSCVGRHLAAHLFESFQRRDRSSQCFRQ